MQSKKHSYLRMIVNSIGVVEVLAVLFFISLMMRSSDPLGKAIGRGMAYLGYRQLAGIHDRDGGGAMSIVFMLAPIASTLAGVVAGIVTAMRMIGHREDVAAGKVATPKRWPIRTRAGTAAVAWSAAVYGVVTFVHWLNEPMSFSSYTIAVIVGWVPHSLR